LNATNSVPSLSSQNAQKSLAAGALPNLSGRAYSAPPDSLAGSRRLLLREREKRGGKGRKGGGEKEGERREERKGRE